MSPEKIAIIGAISSIVSAFVGAIVGAWLTRRSSAAILKQQEFNRAAAEFRSAFIEDQRLLTVGSHTYRKEKTAQIIVNNAINRHELAVIRFRPYFTCRKKREFDNAWEQYCKRDDAKKVFDTSKYAHGDGQYAEIKNKELALRNIEKLLGFAQLK